LPDFHAFFYIFSSFLFRCNSLCFKNIIFQNFIVVAKNLGWHAYFLLFFTILLMDMLISVRNFCPQRPIGNARQIFVRRQQHFGERRRRHSVHPGAVGTQFQHARRLGAQPDAAEEQNPAASHRVWQQLDVQARARGHRVVSGANPARDATPWPAVSGQN